LDVTVAVLVRRIQAKLAIHCPKKVEGGCLRGPAIEVYVVVDGVLLGEVECIGSEIAENATICIIRPIVSELCHAV